LLWKAAQRLEHLRTPEGERIPPNTLAELRRDMARRRLLADQLKQIETTRLQRLKQAPNTGPNKIVGILARVIQLGVQVADASRVKIALMRLTIRLCSETSVSLAAGSLGIFLRESGNRRHLAVMALAPQPAKKGAFEVLGIEAPNSHGVASRSKLILGGFKRCSTAIRPIMAAVEWR
jgi:hypothetical protein